MAAHGAGPTHDDGDPEWDSLLDAWADSLGGPGAWQARLAMDGLDPEDLRSAGYVPGDLVEPDWAVTCDAAFSLFESGWPEDSSGIDLGMIFLPFARMGWDRLQASGGKAWSRWAPAESETDVRAFLATRLVAIAAPICCRAFTAFKVAAPPAATTSGDGIFTAWIAHLRAGGLRQLQARYPVLFRILAAMTIDAADGLAEMILRLDADADDVCALFFPGYVPARLITIDPGLSDRHNHGRQVCALAWPGGRRFYYKPKSVAMDHALHGWINDIRVSGGLAESLPPPLAVLSRDGYGWQAAAIRTAPDSIDGYARKAGGLAALAFALEARDLIMDNLVATKDGPIIIDAEALLQPLCAPATFPREFITPDLTDKLLAAHSFNLNDTGLLGAWQGSSSGPEDIGGFTGSGGYLSSLKQARLVAANTDAMQMVAAPAAVPEESNLPPGPDGKPVSCLPPAAMRDGFRRVSGFLTENAGTLTGDGPDSLSSRFGSRTGRFLLRATGIYARVLLKMSEDMAMRHALLHRLGAEALAKPFLANPSCPPAAWPLVRREIISLGHRDIPFFPLPVDACSQWHIAASGLTMAHRRIGMLDDAALRRQERLLRCAIGLKPPVVNDPDPRLAAARLAGEYLLLAPDDGEDDWLPAAPENGPDSAFPSLAVYHGRSGGAFFLTALFHATGDPRFAARARSEWHRVRQALPRWLDSAPPGASDGIGGILHAALRSARWLRDTAIEDEFTGFAARFAGRLASTRDAGDLAGGMTGGVFALLGLARDFPAIDRMVPALAAAVSPVLCDAAADIDGTTGEIGFAHGWLGLAATLTRTAATTGDQRAMAEAFRLLALAADQASATVWEHLPVRPGLPATVAPMHAWCHGFPGFVMAIAEWCDGQPDNCDAPRQWLGHIATRLATLTPHSCEDPCCGNAGRLEALREAAALGIAPGGLADAASALLDRRMPPGLFRVGNAREDAFLFSPGFFKGQAGIGYLFLRLARPRDFPSLLRWQ